MNDKEYYKQLKTGRLNEHLLLTYDYNSNSYVLINSSLNTDKAIQFVSSTSAKNLIAENLDIPTDRDLLRLPKVKLDFNPTQKFGKVSGSKEREGFNLFNFHNEPNFENLHTAEKLYLNDDIYNLLLNLFEDDLGVNYALNWLSYLVKRNKNQTALLLFGIEGAGKGTIVELMKRVIGSQNAIMIGNANLKADFNEERLGKRLIVVNEVNSFDRNQDVNNSLKTVISDPDILIHPKGRTPFVTRNFGNYIISTNSDNALKISITDRRYSIFQSKEKLSKEIATAIYNLNNDEILDFKKLLWNRDLSSYDPRMPFENLTRKKMMMNTATKKEYLIHLIKNDRNELQTLLDELFNKNDDKVPDYSQLYNDSFYNGVIARTYFQGVKPQIAEMYINSDYKLLQEKNILTSRLGFILYRIAVEDLKSSTHLIGRFYNKFFDQSKKIRIGDKTTKAYILEAKNDS